METTGSLFCSKNQPPVSFLSQMNLDFPLLSQFFNMYLCLGLPSVIFPSCFPTKTLRAFLLSPVSATVPASLIFEVVFDGECKSWLSALHTLLHSPVTSSLIHWNISLGTLFSNTLSLCSSVIVSDQVSHPFKATRKVTFIFLDTNGNAANSGMNSMKHFLDLICSKFIHACSFDLLLSYVTHSENLLPVFVSDIVLHSVLETCPIHLVFSLFPSRPTSLLVVFLCISDNY